MKKKHVHYWLGSTDVLDCFVATGVVSGWIASKKWKTHTRSNIRSLSVRVNTCMDLQWVNSQINFSRIAIMVQPLKDEIAALQLESDKATQQKRTLEAQIDELQRSIARSTP